MSDFLALDEGVSEQQARELIRESARNGGQEFEFPMETADGETIWVVVFLHGIGNFCPIVVDSTVGLWPNWGIALVFYGLVVVVYRQWATRSSGSIRGVKR